MMLAQSNIILVLVMRWARLRKESRDFHGNVSEQLNCKQTGETMKSVKNNLSEVLHDYAGSNEGANFRIYETLEEFDLLVHSG
jgi:predicted RNase H-like HicB family nuclease